MAKAPQTGGLTRSKNRAKVFAELLGLSPELPVPTAVVVGSKGKGTVVAALSYELARSHGGALRVGTITSPPLLHNRERIRINGQAISEAEYATMSQLCADALARMPPLFASPAQQATAHINPAPAGTVQAPNPQITAGARNDIAQSADGYLSPSGLFTIVGLAYLLTRGVDVVVMEEGLGGLSDEVSLFHHHTVVITQIFEEHGELLGGTLRSIARDLVGVLDASTAAVALHPAQPPVVVEEIMQRIADSASAKPAGWRSRNSGHVDVRITPAWSEPPTCPVPPVTSQHPKLAHPTTPAPTNNVLTATNLALASTAAQQLITVLQPTQAPGPHTHPVPNRQHTTSTALPVAQAYAQGRLILPGRTSVHAVNGHLWVVDAAINAHGVRQARRTAENLARGSTLTVLACFPDTKDVTACLAELAGLPVIPVEAGTDYLHYAQLKNAGLETQPVPLAKARVQLAGASTVLAVGTMSFVGEVFDELAVDVDYWW